MYPETIWRFNALGERYEPEQLAKYFIRFVVTVIAGALGLQSFDSQSLGRGVFQAYVSRLGLDIPTEDLIPAGVYRTWGAQSLSSYSAFLDSTAAMLGLALLLGMLAHVLYRRSLASAVSEDLKNPVITSYHQHFHLLTLFFFFLLFVLYFRMAAAAAVAMLLLCISVPPHSTCFSTPVISPRGNSWSGSPTSRFCSCSSSP